MSPLFPSLSGVILAGGSSTRMGRNKALVELDGRPLIQRIADELRLVTDEIWISSNDMQSYRFLPYPTIADLFAGQGPLAGLHAAFARSRRPYVLALACDLPGVRAPWLRGLVEAAGDFDAVIPRTSDGGAHPLAALYRRSCAEALERNLRAGINKVTDLFAGGYLRVRWLTGAEGGFRDEDLVNLNTPQDLRSHLGSRGRIEP